MQAIKIPVADGHTIETYTWLVDEPKAWIHINHGMSEHAKRYEVLANCLNAEGYAVVAHNHRGHGDTCNNKDEILGHFADHQGWQKVLNDVAIVRKNICNDTLPYYLMGHSMGSFIVQAYLAVMPSEQTPIGGLILSGSNFQAPAIAKAGLFLAKFERWRLGARKTSRLIQQLSFGSYNKAFMPAKTEFDWLSSDQETVEQYINDPLCGFECSTQLWIDLLYGLSSLFTTTAFNNMQKGMPIYIFGGVHDPVGENGKGLPKLAKAYSEAGQSSVTLKLYENGRHEMLNERNAEEVMKDLTDWLATTFV